MLNFMVFMQRSILLDRDIGATIYKKACGKKANYKKAKYRKGNYKKTNF